MKDDKYIEKLENLTYSLFSMLKILVEQQEKEQKCINSIFQKANRSELTDLLNEINILKKKLEKSKFLLKEEENIVQPVTEQEQDFVASSKLYSLFLYFSTIFADYHQSQVVKILKETEFIDRNSFNQMLFFLQNLGNFLEILFKELAEIALKNKNLDKKEKFLLIKSN